MGRLWWAGAELGRAGPSFFMSWVAARPGPSNFHLVGRDPARPINFSSDEPRPGPAHQFFRGWTAARPSTSQFQIFTAQPSRIHQIFKCVGPARPGPVHDIGGEAHETRALYGLARHFCGPARGFDGRGHGLAHVLSRTT